MYNEMIEPSKAAKELLHIAGFRPNVTGSIELQHFNVAVLNLVKTVSIDMMY